MAEPTSTYMFFRLLKCSFAHNVTFCEACTGSAQAVFMPRTKKGYMFLYTCMTIMLILSMFHCRAIPSCLCFYSISMSMLTSVCFPYASGPEVQSGQSARTDRTSSGRLGLNPSAEAGSTKWSAAHSNLAVMAECRHLFTLPVFFSAVSL